MSDTIYRQAAIDAANRADYRGLTVEDVKKVTDEVVKEIKKLPSAQSEPDTIYSDGFCDGYKQGIKDAQSKIVCCKDCKYFETDYWVNSILTHEICAICECAVKPDGYCFMAERREK